MLKAWEAVERLVAANAVHRRGFRLAEVGPAFVLFQAVEELAELQEAPDDPEELADLLGVLIHYAQKKGWSMALLEDMMLSKFRVRFRVPNVGEGI